MDFFSDTEDKVQEPYTEELSISFCNGLVALIEKVKARQALSISFPEMCPDSPNTVCGFDQVSFEAAIAAYIPRLNWKLVYLNDSISDFDFVLSEDKDEINKYAILDLIEFIYSNLKDVVSIGNYHSFFNHSHYKSANTEEEKKYFRDEVNTMFRRNNIGFCLSSKGKIERVLSQFYSDILKQHINTVDPTLNSYIAESYKLILSPDLQDRQRALERIWDAYERMKTYYPEVKKKESADKVISTQANNDVAFDKLLHSEYDALTKIGNEFMIRHHETNKIPIIDSAHIDYLFFRMVALVNLFLVKINGRT